MDYYYFSCRRKYLLFVFVYCIEQNKKLLTSLKMRYKPLPCNILASFDP